MSLYQHILAAVDFGKNSIAVLRHAAALAQLCEARLSVLHVVEYSPAPDVDYVIPPADDMEERLIEAAEKQLSQLLVQADLGDSATPLVVAGRPKVEILRIARQEGVDLIVAGAHGRHGILDLLGSTTDRVLHQATCDVLTVRG